MPGPRKQSLQAGLYAAGSLGSLKQQKAHKYYSDGAPCRNGQHIWTPGTDRLVCTRCKIAVRPDQVLPNGRLLGTAKGNWKEPDPDKRKAPVALGHQEALTPLFKLGINLTADQVSRQLRPERYVTRQQVMTDAEKRQDDLNEAIKIARRLSGVPEPKNP